MGHRDFRVTQAHKAFKDIQEILLSVPKGLRAHKVFLEKVASHGARSLRPTVHLQDTYSQSIEGFKVLRVIRRQRHLRETREFRGWAEVPKEIQVIQENRVRKEDRAHRSWVTWVQ